MFFELGSALARRPSARLKRLCPFTIFTNCFGSKVRDSGQSLVPEPPHRIIFVMFFLFLCEILRHYSKIWQIDLNLFLFFAFFASHLLFWGCGGVFTSSKNRNDLCFLHSKNQQKNTKKKNKSKSKRYQNTHRFSSSLFSFLYFLMMIYSAAQSKHATIKSRLILPYPKLS